MNWLEDFLAELSPPRKGEAGEVDPRVFPALASRLEEALSRAEGVEDLKAVLAASSLLLRKAALTGELVLPDLGKVRTSSGRGPAGDAECAAIALGDLGRRMLALPAVASDDCRKFFLDVESYRPVELAPGVRPIVLPGALEGELLPRYGDMLRAAYRAAAGPQGLPPELADGLLEAVGQRLTVHVIAGLEDQWMALLPDLLFDLKALLEPGRRGRIAVHLLTRPFPRLRGAPRAAAEDLEAKKPFDVAFVVCASEEALPALAAEFLVLSRLAPEVLAPPADEPARGVFASYGTARVELPAGQSGPLYLASFDQAFQAAAPSWVPGDAVLAELATERAFFIHPPEAPPADKAWKLCPGLVPVSIPGATTQVCRIQHGLKLADLRLFL